MMFRELLKWPTLWNHFNLCSIFIKERQRISVWPAVCICHVLIMIIVLLDSERELYLLSHTHIHRNVLPPPRFVNTHALSLSLLVSLSSSLQHPPLSPLLLLFPTVNWSRSWTRRAVAASCCHGRAASTSAAASAAARPSPSCSTPSASAVTATTTSARPAGSITSGTKPGSALPARRAGKVGQRWKWLRWCVCVCVCSWV